MEVFLWVCVGLASLLLYFFVGGVFRRITLSISGMSEENLREGDTTLFVALFWPLCIVVGVMIFVLAACVSGGSKTADFVWAPKREKKKQPQE